MYEQKIADAIHEVNKPMARQRDDEDLDRMLREQQRDGDPMAAMLRRKKDRNAKVKGQIVPHYFSDILIHETTFIVHFLCKPAIRSAGEMNTKK